MRDSMTDASHPVTSIASHSSLPFPSSTPFYYAARHEPSPVDPVQEDDGQISCICGYADDDGNTVACDACNRWQHTLCYWPQYEGRDLPEELQHFCVDCRPRDFDAHNARARQRLRRDHQESLLIGAKRQQAKGYKKKAKDSAGSALTNGWPVDKSRQDRNSASPRDQPPPAKRAKTSHRPSDSTANPHGKGHSRKRNVSNANHLRDQPSSPTIPYDYYSDEFIKCYKEDRWDTAHANINDGLNVADAQIGWLRAPDDVFRGDLGYEKPEVLMRWDGELDDIPGKADIRILDLHDPRVKDKDGQPIQWKSITVKEPVASGAYVGELKGRVGFKEQYKEDPQNRWPEIRHPEPFVFFHPRLPLYVDARHEGTQLRYVRRSCQPNAHLQILVTESTNYRFCFMATRQINPGEEVAVTWDTESILHRTSNGDNVSHDEMVELSDWVSTVLSNCGPCACNSDECLMARFDLRDYNAGSEEEKQPLKVSKVKKKKSGHLISPLNTHAANSRSGSEGRKIEPDDARSDSQSPSRSGRGSGSRDLTPSTHYSANGSLTIPELSERERKKLAKEEEMFRRQEVEQSGKQAKKKRNSAGSAANTPGPSASRQASQSSSSKYVDSSTSRPSGLPSARLGHGRRPKPLSTQRRPLKLPEQPLKKPKPTYIHAATQCDMDMEEAAQRAANAPQRPKIISITQRLLQRCAMNNAKAKALISPSKHITSKFDEAMDLDKVDETKPLSPLRDHQAPQDNAADRPPGPEAALVHDMAMSDAPAAGAVSNSTYPIEISAQLQLGAELKSIAETPTLSHPPTNPPAPPWAVKTSPVGSGSLHPSFSDHRKTVDMHLQMPPPTNSFAPSGLPLTAGTQNTITGSIAQSPASITTPGPLFSPAVSAAVAPSPARRTMSLSDYTKRSKAKDKENEAKVDRESSPASAASASLPPLPNSVSDGKAAESLGMHGA